MVKYRGYSCARRSDRIPCEGGVLCPKCSLFQVIGERFRAFRKQFGRDPGPAEPLFFEPNRDQPVAAEITQAVEQIESAARALNIDPEPVFGFLRLDSVARDARRQSREQAAAVRERPISGKHPLRRGSRESAAQAAAGPANPRQLRQRSLFGVADRRTERPSRPAPQSRENSPWKRFVDEERTHGRHRITKAEWAVLSKVAMMGEASAPSDFIFILNTIRQAARA
jgi:hypothetical protein